MLGDDNLALQTKMIDDKDLKKTIKLQYNMLSKNSNFTNGGEFCGMIAYKRPDGTAGLGPNFKRLRNRYECMSGKTESTMEMLDLKAMSVLMTLGSNDRTEKIVKAKNFPIKLT